MILSFSTLRHNVTDEVHTLDASLIVDGDVFPFEESECNQFEEPTKWMTFVVKGHGDLDGNYIARFGDDCLESLCKVTDDGEIDITDDDSVEVEWSNHGKSIESDDPIWEMLGY